MIAPEIEPREIGYLPLHAAAHGAAQIGPGVGLLMPPRTAAWKGIRNLHKTGSTTTILTIPRLVPSC